MQGHGLVGVWIDELKENENEKCLNAGCSASTGLS